MESAGEPLQDVRQLAIRIDTPDGNKDGQDVAPASSEVIVSAEAGDHETSSEVRQVINGTECGIKTLYEGPEKCKCCINWVEELPEELQNAVEERDDVKTKAIIARMKKNHREGKKIELDSIVVQNADIREFLCELFHDYQGITPELKKLVLRAPFHAFFFKWEEFKSLQERFAINKPQAAPYVALLYDLLRPEIEPVFDEVKDMLKNGVITYDLLWAIFRPSEEVYTTVLDEDRMCLLKSCEHTEIDDKPYFTISMQYVDWDGHKFGFREHGTRIESFTGTKSIQDLSVFPFHLHPAADRVRTKLLDRGRKFREYCVVQHQSYTGIAAIRDGQSKLRRFDIDGQVMLDTPLYYKNAKGRCRTPVLISLKDKLDKPELDLEEQDHHGKTASSDSDSDTESSSSETRGADDFEGSDWVITTRTVNSGSSGQDQPDLPQLKDEELLLCSSMIPAFHFGTKEWVLLLDIGAIRPIVWNETAFSNLVLPATQKDLVLSFVEAHISGDVRFDDIIQGKGLGLLMLLVGEPGLGKTLTAEAVAEKVHRPLYMLSGAELGRHAAFIENTLRSVLEMTAKWNAVLLLDECDVFLEVRNAARLDHNAIVATFLRHLEYYEGILILTSNRPDSIDPAFQSRIHLTLRYPSLTSEAKTVIWKNFVGGTKWFAGHALVDEDYRKLALLDVNGREIKNIVKTGFLLASREKGPLRLDHIKKVVDATMKEGLLQ